MTGAETQATVGAWSDALLAQGIDVLGQSGWEVLRANDTPNGLIWMLVQAHRQGRDLASDLDKRMAVLRRDHPTT